MPNIYRQSQLFRAALLRRERRAATELAQAYTRIFASLQKELDRVVVRSATEGTAGLIIREQQLRMLLAQVERRATKFTAIAVNKITETQASEIEHGAEDAINLLRRAYTGAPPGLTISFAQLPEGVIESMAGNLGDGSPLRLLLNQFGPEASREISAMLINSVAAGRSIRKIAQDMRRLSQEPLARTLLVARTEVLRAYRQSSIATYQANKDVVKGWTWVSAASARTCIACFMLHGSVHSNDETFGSHPNCLTAEAVIVAPGATAYTSRWFDGDVIDIHTVGGYSLTVTPNHPILTSAGWIAAQFLYEGGDVISSSDTQRVAAAVSPNDYNAPARIEQIWKSLAANSQMLRRTVPAASKDFHGDGVGSEVDVVWANSFLRDSFDTSFFEPCRHQAFGGRRPRYADFSRFSSSNPGADRLLTATDGGLSGKHITALLFRGTQGHAQSVGFGLTTQLDSLAVQPMVDNSARGIEAFSKGSFRFPDEIGGSDFNAWDRSEGAIVPQGNSVLNQHAVDYFKGDPETSSELLTRLTGLVSGDKIVKIRRRPFSGQVYNLQTKPGWYSANNIITHNCRCTAVPITKSWADLGFSGMVEQPPVQSGQSQFLMLPANEQRRIMGDASYKAWRAGAVSLEDFVGVKQSRQWGETHYTRSLREILGPDAQQYYKPAEPVRRAA